MISINIRNIKSNVAATANWFVSSEYGKLALATSAITAIATAAVTLPPAAVAVGTAVVVTSGLGATAIWAFNQLAEQ